MISAQVVGAKETSVAFYNMAVAVPMAVSEAVAREGRAYHQKVLGRASGRPGPNVVTGKYKRSIKIKVQTIGGAWAAIIGTDAVQGRRLENGFLGEDSLGRSYHQMPFPHFEPDLEAAGAAMQRAVAAAVGFDAEINMNPTGISAVSFS